jgi:hypothetical protein
MSDGRYRELERRASTGDIEAETALLRERLRIGTITDAQLRFAAFLGHLPAKNAVDKCPKCHDAGIDPGSVWLGVLPPGPDFPKEPRPCPVCGHTTYTFESWTRQLQALAVWPLPRCKKCRGSGGVREGSYAPITIDCPDCGPDWHKRTAHHVAVRSALAAARYTYPWWVQTRSKPAHMSCVPNCKAHQGCADWREKVKGCLDDVAFWLENPNERRMQRCIRRAGALNYGAQFVFHTCRATLNDGAGRSSANTAIAECARLHWGSSSPPEIAERLIQQAIVKELVPWVLA